MKIQNLTENFDEEIENILIENGTITADEMIYEGHNIAKIPFKSDDEEKKFVEEKCILLEDETYFYIVCSEATILEATGSGFAGEDYIVQRVLKRKHDFLGGN